ncbi:hypothetical protein KXR53_33850 [Inquilinus limosus]|uniref:hypothetical protein n=1 Tax=Inquilinus limosus TaxID=171674 RepID=UPI003F16AF39
MRGLVDRITLVPEGGTLSIVPRGDLAAMLVFASNSKKPSLLGDGLVPGSLVAGTGYHRYPYKLAIAV